MMIRSVQICENGPIAQGVISITLNSAACVKDGDRLHWGHLIKSKRRGTKASAFDYGTWARKHGL